MGVVQGTMEVETTIRWRVPAGRTPEEVMGALAVGGMSLAFGMAPNLISMSHKAVPAEEKKLLGM